MWTHRRVVGLGALPWTIWSGLSALLPYAAILWWVHGRLTDPGGWLSAVGFYAAFLAVRFLGAGWYSWTARRYGGWSLLTAGTQVMEVNARQALVVGLWQWPIGALLGVSAWTCGLFATPPGGWWWVVLIAVPVGQAILLFGTAWLYTWLVVSMSRPFMLFAAPSEATAERALREAVPGRTRTVVGTLVYAWIVCGAVAVIITLLTGLFVLVHHVPAGYFGIGVALFVGFSVAVTGFPLAVVLGLWFQAIAALYKSVGRGVLRLRWQEVRVPVRVE